MRGARSGLAGSGAADCRKVKVEGGKVRSEFGCGGEGSPLTRSRRIEQMGKKEKSKWVPPFERVVVELRERLRARNEDGDGFFGTEVSLAEETGVSRMTVRKSVNVLIAEGHLERRPGIGLFVRGSDPTGFVYKALFGNLFWDPSIKAATAIRQAAEKVGARVDYFDAGGEERRFLREIAALPASGAKGAIIFSQHGAAFDAAIASLARTGFPFVVIDESVALPGVTSLVSDNARGGLLAAEELLAAGHRELAFIGDFAADTVVLRWNGFVERCRGEGVAPTKHDIRSTSRLGDWASDVREIIEKVMRRKVRPTAIFCSCDAVARIVMRWMDDHGLKVPHDLSLVGFDDDPIAEWTSPALTTIRQDFAKMGGLAVAELINRVGHPSKDAKTVVVPVERIRRGSVERR